MALPESFQDPDEYIRECFDFFEKYSYLYKHPNTEILVHNVLDSIDVEGLEDIDVFENNFDLSTNICNDFLQDFFARLKKLWIHYPDFVEENLELSMDVPLSPKKKHEIVYLAKEIGEVCAQIHCDTVVDFGSGLGYLDQQIFLTSGLNVLGLECNENHYVGAKKRQRQYHLNSTDKVKYIKHRVTVDSCDNIVEYVNDKFKTTGFCISGLHACADLSIDAINIFLKMEHARAIVIMPCCYHKIEIQNGGFKNFPLSERLKNAYFKVNGLINVPFLRLATQPPDITEEKLEDLVFSLLARATLQVYAHTHGYILKRKKRKAVRLKSKHNVFETYITDATTNGFSLSPENSLCNDSPVFDIEQMTSFWREIHNPSTLKKAAIFIVLQNYLQPVFENFVLFDRLLYLKENGIENCEFKRIVNEKVSPRCFALIARK